MTEIDKNTRGFTYAIVIGLTAAIQFYLVSYTFPLSELFSDKPLLHVDSPYHWYQIFVAQRLASDWLLTGYDPFFSAGYIAGVPFNASAKIPAYLTRSKLRSKLRPVSTIPQAANSRIPM